MQLTLTHVFPTAHSTIKNIRKKTGTEIVRVSERSLWPDQRLAHTIILKKLEEAEKDLRGIIYALDMRGEDLARKLEITEVCHRLTLTQFNFKIRYGLGI